MENRNLKIKRAIINNFRKIISLDFDFDETESLIVGPNGSGKTTVAEAWYWLWTGYDLARQNNFEINPKDDDGNLIDEHAVTSVEFFLDLNGYEFSLKKEMHRKYVPTSDDDPTPKFKENYFLYYENGVDTKTKKAFQEKLDKIVPKDDFEVMGNSDYFLRMEQKELRRAILNLVGGELSDEELLSAKPQYEKLLNILKHKTIEVYQTETKTALTAAEAQKKGIPALIEENSNKLTKLPTEVAFKTIEKSIVNKKAKAKEISEEINGKKTGESFELYEQYKIDLAKSKSDFEQYKTKYATNLRKKNADKENEKELIQSMIDKNKSTIKSFQNNIIVEQSQINSINITLEKWLQEWRDIDAQEFIPPQIPEEGEEMPKCQSCGKPYTLEELLQNEDVLYESFNSEQIDKKKVIEERGSLKHADKLALEQAIIDNQNKIQVLEKTNEELNLKIDAIILEPSELETTEEYVGFIESISVLEDAIANPPKAETEDLEEDLRILEEEIDELNQQLGQRKVRKETEARINELMDQEVAVNKKLMDLKKIDSIIKSYLKDRSEILEQKVNSRFELIKFELFSYNNDGTPKLDCNPTIFGAHYKVVNTALRSAAQIDVMNTYAKKTGIHLPIFLDNWESVGEVPETHSQLVKIEYRKAMKDPELAILIPVL